jgi:ATP-dependent RNA helicase RhlE
LTQLFTGLGLSAALTRAVTEAGYTVPTPVQTQAIPVILEGRDVLAGAQTGTGKTAGFTLPLLQRLSAKGNDSYSPARHPVRALILTPTRELAAQVEESVRTYGKHLPLRTTLVYGGVGINPQIHALRRGVDILVATPGRLLDHVQQKTVDLSRVEIFVLDEADRMLDMGFIPDIRRIMALLPKRRQNLLFSATFSDEIRRLADGLLHNPVTIEVARRNAPSELVVHRVHPVATVRKRELLAHLVASGDWRQVLVFTRTKHGANRLAEQLARGGIQATAIHGNKSQPQRTRALADFKAGTLRVLVATDIAARGLDIEELPHVINFDMPHVAEDYVHRIGRTGRAGSTGEAISLVAPEELPLLGAVEKLLGRRLERQVIAGFESGSVSRHANPQSETQQAQKPRQGRQPRRNEGRRHQGKPAAAYAEHRPRNDGGHRHKNKPAADTGQRALGEDGQPKSNEGQLFPSSAKVFGAGSAGNARATFGGARRARGGRGAPPAPLLGSGRRRTG